MAPHAATAAASRPTPKPQPTPDTGATDKTDKPAAASGPKPIVTLAFDSTDQASAFVAKVAAIPDPAGPKPSSDGRVDPAVKAMTDSVAHLRAAVDTYINNPESLHSDIHWAADEFAALGKGFPSRDELLASTDDPHVKSIIKDNYPRLKDQFNELTKELKKLQGTDGLLEVNFSEYEYANGTNYFEDLRHAKYDGDDPYLVSLKQPAQDRLDKEISVDRFNLPANASLDQVLTTLNNPGLLRRIEQPYIDAAKAANPDAPVPTDAELKTRVISRISKMNPNVDFSDAKRPAQNIIVPHEYSSLVTGTKGLKFDTISKSGGEHMTDLTRRSGDELIDAYGLSITMFGASAKFAVDLIPTLSAKLDPVDVPDMPAPLPTAATADQQKAYDAAVKSRNDIIAQNAALEPVAVPDMPAALPAHATQAQKKAYDDAVKSRNDVIAQNKKNATLTQVVPDMPAALPTAATDAQKKAFDAAVKSRNDIIAQNDKNAALKGKLLAFQGLIAQGQIANSNTDKIKDDLKALKESIARPMGNTKRDILFALMLLLDITVIGLIALTILSDTGAVTLPKQTSNLLSAALDMTAALSSSDAYRAAKDATNSRLIADLDMALVTPAIGGAVKVGADKQATVALPAATAAGSSTSSSGSTGSGKGSAAGGTSSATPPATGSSGKSGATAPATAAS